MKLLLACEFYSPSVGGVQEVTQVDDSTLRIRVRRDQINDTSARARESDEHVGAGT